MSPRGRLISRSPSSRTSSKQTSSCWTGHRTRVYCFSACFESLKRQTSGDYETACYWASCVRSIFLDYGVRATRALPLFLCHHETLPYLVGSVGVESTQFVLVVVRRRLHWVGIVGLSLEPCSPRSFSQPLPFSLSNLHLTCWTKLRSLMNLHILGTRNSSLVVS